MTDTDEILARMAARLNPEPPPYPDQREEVERLQRANEDLHHTNARLRNELRGAYAKLELRDAKSEGDRHLDGNSFASLEQSADAIK